MTAGINVLIALIENLDVVGSAWRSRLSSMELTVGVIDGWKGRRIHGKTYVLSLAQRVPGN